jgi:uncharacterized protein YutE (UPF0331/DUF86 family)
MDPDIVKAKLESLSRCIARIESKAPESAQDLMRDPDAQDIIALNLERAVQLCVDIGSHVLLDFDVPSPESMSGVFAALGKAGVLSVPLAERMSKAAGFRNIAVHDYASVDWNIVFSIVTTRLGDFRGFAEAVMRRLDET